MLTIAVLLFVLLSTLARLIVWALGEDWQTAHYNLTMTAVRLNRWACVAGFAWFALLVYFVLTHLAYGPGA